MSSFRADIVVRFESESLETAGRELRRLAEAAHRVGFELETGRIEPLKPHDSTNTEVTRYAPIDPGE